MSIASCQCLNWQLFLYRRLRASTDTRLHVATTVEKMLDYCKNTLADGYITLANVQAIILQHILLIDKYQHNTGQNINIDCTYLE